MVFYQLNINMYILIPCSISFFPYTANAPLKILKMYGDVLFITFLEEWFNILENMLIRSFTESWMKRLIPLSSF